MRKSGRYYDDDLYRRQAIATKYENMRNGASAKTWSAEMAAYCYTELCPVPGQRMHPADVGRSGVKTEMTGEGRDIDG